MSPENQARLDAALDRIDAEQRELAANEPELCVLEEISMNEAQTELSRAKNRYRSAIAAFRNSDSVHRETRERLSRQMSDARRDMVLAAWRVRAMEAEARLKG